MSGARPPISGRLERERLPWGKGRPEPGPWRGRGVLADSRADRGRGEPNAGWGRLAAAPNRLYRDKPGAGAGRASLGAGRRGAGLQESTPPPAPGPPRAARPPAGEPLSRAWPVRVRLLNLGTAGRLGTGLGGGADLGLGGLGSRSRPRPRGPASCTPSLCCSRLLGGERPGAPLFPSLPSLPHSGARGRSRPSASSRRGVARCGADSGPADTLSKLSGSGWSRLGAQAAAAPADPLLDRRNPPSSRAQTWST